MIVKKDDTTLKLVSAGRVRRVQGNTAHVLVADNADVTRFTPASTPRVLDGPVVLSGGRVGTITGDEDAMVQIGTTATIENTTTVELKRHLVGFNGNRDRANVGGGQEGSLIVGRDISVTRDGSGTCAATGLAGTIAGSVGIVTFSAESTVLDDVFKTIVHETAVAAHVTLRTSTVNKLLLGEGFQSSSGNLVSTFERASSGKGPAGTI